MAFMDAWVTLEYSKVSGAFVKSQKFKKMSRVELDWNGPMKKLDIIIATPGEKQLRFPMTPPVQMAAAQIMEGRMSIILSNCKMTYSSEPRRIQIMLASENSYFMVKLRDAVNACMSRIVGKPLHQLPKKEEPAINMQERLLRGKRKADALSAAPSGSEVSTGSRDSGADITSKLQTPNEYEDLPDLSDEQMRVLEMAREGKNVFFTGCAGTGKSLVLKHILKSLPTATTFVTASTGIAASHLGGTTLHAFAGIGRAQDLAAALPGAKSRDTRQRWQKATTLIIDEVSMVDAKLFELVEEVARYIRSSEEPFGGIQIILCGDFHQLPPVFVRAAEGTTPRKFCFECEAWRSCELHCMQLTKVYRQADEEFVEMLGKVRAGQGGSVVKELMERCSRPVDINGIIATKLFTHRADVDLVNAQELQKLSGDVQKFLAKDVGNEETLRISCPARKNIELKIGAQVMLIRNISQRKGLVNGARGVIERWVGKSNPLPVVRFVNGTVTTIGKEKWNIVSGGKSVASRTQLPLELGWAVTVHKCQGMTLDAVQINLEKAFEPGMAYVALSRVKSLDGLQIVGGIDRRALQAHPKVLSFYKALERFAVNAISSINI